MKKYFQKLYNETGKKPFTPLNFFLMLGIPVIITVLVSGMQSGTLSIAAILAAIIVGWIINLVLCITKFGNKGVGLFFLTLLASIAFFCSFILWPLLKWSYRASQAAMQANLGNVSASVNASRRAAATKGKKSALNWFSYDGTVYRDEKEVMPQDIGNYTYDEGSYTYDQNQAARGSGYSNGKDAEMHGRQWNGQSWQ